MREEVLLVAVILMWIAVLAGAYQRLFDMPKWFADPPASFERIRKQIKQSRLFWILLSILFIALAGTALLLNRDYAETRVHIIGGLIFFGLTVLLSALYFVREVVEFTKIPANAQRTPELLRRVKFWLRWTSVRNVLQLVAAIFMTIAYLHSGNL